MNRNKWRVLWLAYKANPRAAQIWPQYDLQFRRQMRCYKQIDICAVWGSDYATTLEVREILESIHGRSIRYNTNHIFE